MIPFEEMIIGLDRILMTHFWLVGHALHDGQEEESLLVRRSTRGLGVSHSIRRSALMIESEEEES